MNSLPDNSYIFRSIARPAADNDNDILVHDHSYDSLEEGGITHDILIPDSRGPSIPPVINDDVDRPVIAVSSETKLAQYTDNHYMHRLNSDLDKIRAAAAASVFMPEGGGGGGAGDVGGSGAMMSHYNSNSPLTLSNDNSDSDNDGTGEERRYVRFSNTQHSRFRGNFHHPAILDKYAFCGDGDGDGESVPKQYTAAAAVVSRSPSKFRRLTYEDAEQYLEKYYDNDKTYSSELDILITYMKGQKNLYIQSKNVSEYKLNMLLIPSLLMIAAITIFAPFIQQYEWSGGFISGLNAISTLLITLANYLKLESSTQTFYHTACQYDKLETSLEFVTSKLLFVQDDAEKSRVVLGKIQEIEKKISEIKEWNTLFVPEQVRRMFPTICHINIFSFIKRMEIHKKNLIIKFKDIKNEIRYITHQLSTRDLVDGSGSGVPVLARHRKRLDYLLDVKDKIKEELAHCKTAYTHIDDIFTREIQDAQRKKWCNLAFGLVSSSPRTISLNNPIIDQYLRCAP